MDRSLLRLEAAEQGGGATRYSLHPLLRQYAAEKLAESPEEEAATRGRHGRFYLAFLEANQDPRAQELLDTAHDLLQEQAAKITDEKMRHSFLENVAAHRELVQALGRRSESQLT